MNRKIIAVLMGMLLLTGCSSYGDGESSALQKALNSYLGGSATLKYPASGDFLSPFAFGDWDGDGEDESAVLYTADTTGSNVCLAVLEPSGEDSWRVSRTVEGLSSEVENFNTANLKNAESQQLVVGYSSAQGDSYCVVYQYDGANITTVISQSYTQLLLADLTGKKDTTDLVLALPEDGRRDPAIADQCGRRVPLHPDIGAGRRQLQRMRGPARGHWPG